MMVVKGRSLTSVHFSRTKGIKQGFCISPTLFNIYLCTAVKQWVKKCSPMKIQRDTSLICTSLFTDDQMAIARGLKYKKKAVRNK